MRPWKARSRRRPDMTTLFCVVSLTFCRVFVFAVDWASFVSWSPGFDTSQSIFILPRIWHGFGFSPFLVLCIGEKGPCRLFYLVFRYRYGDSGFSAGARQPKGLGRHRLLTLRWDSWLDWWAGWRKESCETKQWCLNISKYPCNIIHNVSVSKKIFKKI